ncbi:MAG: Alanine dehydrogenase, partial [uncultured Solirubrobacteraceae bacterium]
ERADPRGDRDVAQAGRAPARPASLPAGRDRPGAAPADLRRARLRGALRGARRGPVAVRRRPALPRGARGGVRRRAAPQAAGRGSRRLPPGAGPVGLAPLRPGRRDHPGGHRSAADPHRMGGDEPLDGGGSVRHARLPRQQRARGLRVRDARPRAGRPHGRVRAEAQRRGHLLRRDGPRGGRRAGRPRDPRHHRAHAARAGVDRLAARVRAPRDVGAVRGRPGPRRRRRGRRRGADRHRARAARHRRQLRPAGHGGAADLRVGRGAARPRAGHPGDRRVLRRGHGLRVGAADHVRRADDRGGRPRPLLRRRPQPVAPLGLRHLGDLRGARALPGDGHGRARRVGRRADHRARDRDPRRRGAEPPHPHLPGPRAGLSPRAVL